VSEWPLVQLGDCAEIVSGATPSTAQPDYWNGEIWWATPRDLSRLTGSRISLTERRITSAGLANCGATVLPVGAVLLSSRAPIGHTAINTVPMATNQGFKSLIPRSSKLDSGYLLHWLRANRQSIEALGNGATFKEVSKAIVSSVKIPLPPLPEQRRIAAILGKAGELRARRRAALAQLDTLTQSIFVGMFGDPVTNTKGWPSTVVLSDVADIASGVTKGRALTGKSTRRVSYLAVSNVQDRSLDLSTVKEIPATEDEIARYRLEHDDLLLTEGGDPDKLGRGTLWKSELPECIHQNHIFRVRLRSTEVRPLFLNWLVGSSRGKRYFLRSAKQTTGIASINMTQLKAFPLLLPPIERQRAFEHSVSAIEAMKERLDAAIVAADGLFSSLQHRAFRGVL